MTSVLTILEYYQRRVLGLPISRRQHPMRTKRRTLNTWKMSQAIQWFDEVFPLDTIKQILEVLPELTEEQEEQFNSWKLLRKSRDAMHSKDNSFLSNPVWAAKASTTVTCCHCKTSASTRTEIVNKFPIVTNTKLGVDTVCRNCRAELEFHKGQSFAIKGPYCRLKDAKRCIKCSKVYPPETIPLNFKVNRVPLVHQIVLPVSRYKNICKACEFKKKSNGLRF